MGMLCTTEVDMNVTVTEEHIYLIILGMLLGLFVAQLITQYLKPNQVQLLLEGMYFLTFPA